MLHAMLGGSSGSRGRVRRLWVVALVLLCATVLSALVMPTRAEAKRLNVRFVIDNIDEHPEARNIDFTYICSFFRWDDYTQGGWRLSTTTGQWEWQDLDKAFGTNRAVSTPNDQYGYWYDLRFRHGQTQTLDAGDRSVFYFYPSIGPNKSRRTDPGLSLKNMDYPGGAWQVSYNDRGYGPQSLVPFNFGGFTGTGDGTVILHFRYDKGIPAPKPIVPDLKLEPSKQIDYLGDGQPNVDTKKSGANDYRLYLTGKTVDNTQYTNYKSKNIILAVDISLSMRYNFDGTGNTWERFSSLKRAATRLINGLGASDLNNTFSVVSFSSDDKYLGGSGGSGTYVRAKTVSASTAQATVNSLTAAPSGGTDYYSAFRRIDDCCVSDKENIVLFLTDGEPTSVPKDILRRDMGSTAQSVIATAWTKKAAGDYLKNVKGFYSVFIGTNSGSAAVLSMITRATPISDEDRASVQASSDSEMQALVDALTNRLKKPAITVAIEDKLSKYVTYYPGTQKVTAMEENGHVEKLNSGDYRYSFDRSSNTIKLDILKPASKNTTYVLSYDVRASKAAVDAWLDGGQSYPSGMVGDPNTDYLGNTTSSGKPGFFSNEMAVGRITYDLGQGVQSVSYDFPKPVVQVKYDLHAAGQIRGHVTLYNQKLDSNRFFFQLLDKDGNEIKFYNDKHEQIEITNDGSGDFSFPSIEYKAEGDYDYTIRQVVPADTDANGYSDGEKMTYTHDIKVHVKVTRGDDSYIATPTYDNPPDSGDPSVAHFFNTYGIPGTYK